MTMRDIAALLVYWSEVPPPHESLARLVIAQTGWRPETKAAPAQPLTKIPPSTSKESSPEEWASLKAALGGAAG